MFVSGTVEFIYGFPHTKTFVMNYRIADLYRILILNKNYVFIKNCAFLKWTMNRYCWYLVFGRIWRLT